MLGFTTQTQYQVQISFLLDFVVHFCTCSQTVFCDRQFLSVANYCTLLHRENGSFEVLCSACLIKTCSSTCHHVSDLSLSLLSLISSSLSSASTPSQSSSPLSWSSSSMWLEPTSTKPNAHTQNEEYCPVAIHNPLTPWRWHPFRYTGSKAHMQNAVIQRKCSAGCLR